MIAGYLTVSQVAARLGVSSRRVQYLIQRGQLPADKIGMIWLVKENDLAAVMVRGKPGRPRKAASTETQEITTDTL